MGAWPAWNGYVLVDDADVYSERVKAASGAIHRAPEDIPGVGRFSVAADPHGAVFILFEGASDDGARPAAPGTPGHVGWHELHAGDLESAFAFYSGLFGWTKGEAISMGPMGVYQTFATGGASGGMMTKTPETPAPFWLYYFNVDAVEAAMARVKDAGGQSPSTARGGSGREVDRAVSRPAGRHLRDGGPEALVPRTPNVRIPIPQSPIASFGFCELRSELRVKRGTKIIGSTSVVTFNSRSSRRSVLQCMANFGDRDTSAVIGPDSAPPARTCSA